MPLGRQSCCQIEVVVKGQQKKQVKSSNSGAKVIKHKHAILE